MSKISANEYPLKTVFSRDFNYYIPGYQRPYAWEKEQTETLFNDLYDAFRRMPGNIPEGECCCFLGSIVLIKEEYVSKSYVVDGQQRLTTLTILFAALANRMKDADFRSGCMEYVNERGRIAERIKPEPRLHLRSIDQDFFGRYIQYSGANPAAMDPVHDDYGVDGLLRIKESDESKIKNESQRHIRENCELLDMLIEENLNEDGEPEAFLSFLVNNCWMVVVSATDPDSAYRIFSVMNSTGLDLSTTDILKADIIGRIDEVEQPGYTDKWEELEIKTSRQGFADLFSHIRMIETKRKAGQSVLEEFRKEVIPKYSSKSFIDDVLEPYADYYAEIMECKYGTTSGPGSEIGGCFRWLKRIGNSDWVPSMLLFVKKHRDDDEYVLWFCSKLERLAAYLLMTNKYVNERIERYSKILREIERGQDGSIANPIRSVELTDEEKKEFAVRLNDDIYDRLSSNAKRYLMLRLDSFVAGEGVVSDYDPKVLTIEHVLPQTVNPVSGWARDWPDENERAEWTHKIANLVPLARKANSAAQNFDFERKKSEYFMGKNGTAAYALITQIALIKEWTPDIVKDRQKTLTDKLIDKWELR